MEYKLCPACQAQNRRELSRCWLCGADLLGASATTLRSELPPMVAAVPSAIARPERSRVPPLAWGAATFFLLVGFAALLFGVFQEAAGLGILLLIAIAPGLITIAMVGRERRSGWELTATFFIQTTFIAIMLAVLVLLAAVLSFLVICGGMIGGMNQPKNADIEATLPWIWGIAGGLAVLGSLLSIFVGVRLNRKR